MDESIKKTIQLPSNSTFSYLKIKICEEFNIKNTEIEMHLPNPMNTFLSQDICETNSVDYFGK